MCPTHENNHYGAHQHDYPLDGPMSFERYDHRRLTVRDIMVHRLMAGYMTPSLIPRVVHAFLEQPTMEYPNCVPDFVKDMIVTNRLLFTSVTTDKSNFTLDEYILSTVAGHYLETDNIAFRTWVSRTAPPRRPDGPVSNSTGGSTTRSDRKSRQRLFDLKLERQSFWNGKSWGETCTEHVRSIRPGLAVQDQLPLYDGGTVLPSLRRNMDRSGFSVHGSRMAMRDTHWTISTHFPARGNFSAFPEWEKTMRWGWLGVLNTGRRTCIVDTTANPGRGRQPNRVWHNGWRAQSIPLDKRGCLPAYGYGKRISRASSEPPPGAISFAQLPVLPNMELTVAFPTMTPIYLDQRTRRRSLSRTRIQEMFDWDTDISTHSPRGQGKTPGLGPSRVKRPRPCENCKMFGHVWTECDAPCGHCGAPSPQSFDEFIAPVCDFTEQQDHLVFPRDNNPYLPGYHQNPHHAPECPVPRQNRCKCVPFPTFHTAKRCGIPCRRPCGNPHRPGTFKHKNAMACKSRCCMCGAAGHSGKDCRFKTCRCGEPHLGQDCTWNPVCKAEGCSYYLCSMHCRQCGSSDRPFIGRGRMCWKCKGHQQPPPKKEKKAKGAEKGKAPQALIDRFSLKEGEPIAGNNPSIPVNPESSASNTLQMPYVSIFGDSTRRGKWAAPEMMMDRKRRKSF